MVGLPILLVLRSVFVAITDQLRLGQAQEVCTQAAGPKEGMTSFSNQGILGCSSLLIDAERTTRYNFSVFVLQSRKFRLCEA